MCADPVSRIAQTPHFPPPHISGSRTCPSRCNKESRGKRTGFQDWQDEFEVGSVPIVERKLDRHLGLLLPSHLCDEADMPFKHNGFKSIGEFAWKGFNLVI